MPAEERSQTSIFPFYHGYSRSEADMADKTKRQSGAVELSEHELRKARGGSSGLAGAKARKDKDSNDVGIEEMTIVHEGVVWTK